MVNMFAKFDEVGLYCVKSYMVYHIAYPINLKKKLSNEEFHLLNKVLHIDQQWLHYNGF